MIRKQIDADKVIAEYLKTKVVHPSYSEIAKKTKTNKSFVYRTINAYLAKLSKGK